MTTLATRLEERMRAIGTPDRAASEKAYLKSDLSFFGVRLADIRAAVKELAEPMDHDALVSAVAELWSEPNFERRMGAVILLSRNDDRLGVGDLPLVERLVRESGTWSLVDALATDVLARLVVRDPDRMSPPMDRWATDADFWIRRSSLLAELRTARAGGPLDRFFARAERMLDEREFFIRKAIGWVLREASKRDPVAVAAWIAPRTQRASGVTMREAVKYLPPDLAEPLLTGHRERRPAN